MHRVRATTINYSSNISLKCRVFFAPNQEIVYRDKVRFTYTTLFERINRLAGGLEKLVSVRAIRSVCSIMTATGTLNASSPFP